MSFDRAALRRLTEKHGKVARIVVADVKGSVPREVGASMWVWTGENGIEQAGTIGGGTLEYDACQRAFDAPRLRRLPLGPAMGQCCGGAVTLLTEVFDKNSEIPKSVYARGPDPMPLAVQRICADARAQGQIAPQLIGSWMVEPVNAERQPLWVWGAGHVGRAIVETCAPLPGFEITWIDTHTDRFPDALPGGVTQLTAQKPEQLVRHAPKHARHLVLTFSHALDLALCHGLLAHDFDFAGLIGSKTKWARFRARLRDLGHSDAQISRICCPIGQPGLGKHPHAIAIGVAASLISHDRSAQTDRKKTG